LIFPAGVITFGWGYCASFYHFFKGSNRMSRDREWDRNSRCMRVGREQGAGGSLLTITNPDNFLFFLIDSSCMFVWFHDLHVNHVNDGIEYGSNNVVIGRLEGLW
jgi:hypothetical protein